MYETIVYPDRVIHQSFFRKIIQVKINKSMEKLIERVFLLSSLFIILSLLHGSHSQCNNELDTRNYHNTQEHDLEPEPVMKDPKLGKVIHF